MSCVSSIKIYYKLVEWDQFSCKADKGRDFDFLSVVGAPSPSIYPLYSLFMLFYFPIWGMDLLSWGIGDGWKYLAPENRTIAYSDTVCLYGSDKNLERTVS